MELTSSIFKKQFNPFSSFVPLIAQLVIIIALFQVLKGGIGPTQIEMVYDFIKKPINFSPLFLKAIDLSRPNLFLAILTGGVQFIYSKITFSLQKICSQKRKRTKKKTKPICKKYYKIK
jgi:membrane protein insertase Oxa1/YidC/SpoIIIJ